MDRIKFVRQMLSPDSNETWSKRRLRLASRRFGKLKDMDETDSSPSILRLVVKNKPSAMETLRSELQSRKMTPESRYQQEDQGERGEEGQDVVDRRTLGMGLAGDLAHRQYDSEVVNLPHVQILFESWTDYRPYFSYWISFVQVIIVILALLSSGFGPLGLGLRQESGLVLTEWLTLEQISVEEPSSVWIGPGYKDLVRLGATFAPCMRNDFATLQKFSADVEREGNFSGCCIRNDMSGCVQTFEENCSPVLSTFLKWTETKPGPEGRKSGPVCGLDPHYCESPVSNGPYTWPDDISKWPICTKPKSNDEGTPRHLSCQLVARPCCIGIHGKCELKSSEYCEWVGGTYHPEASLCSQVSCMADVCGLLPFAVPDRPDQFYRLWTSLFLNAGIVHTIISVLFQLSFMRDIEKMCGSWRIAVIFFASGIMGNLTSLLFTPYRPESGPSGALFGVLATMASEVLRSWALLLYPWRAIGQIMLVFLGLFICGLLPWVDNYAHVGGFFTGFAISYALLPQVEVSNIAGAKKDIAAIVLTIAVVAVFFIMLTLFYLVPFEECEWCQWISCIPFTRDFCAELNINYEKKRHLF